MKYKLKAIHKPLKAKISLPGDKSISHRSLLFSALAVGKSEVEGLLMGADVLSTKACLEKLGVVIEIKANQKVIIDSPGVNNFSLIQWGDESLDCGNSGTTMRLLMGVLAGLKSEEYKLLGDQSLTKRPMKRVATPLIQMGANIDLRDENYPPVLIKGRPLKGINYSLPIASAQIKSAIILAALMAEGETVITGEIYSRDHTEKLLPHFGGQLVVKSDQIKVEGRQKFEKAKLKVPGDFSSAAFWLAACQIVEGSELEFENLSLNPTRTGFMDVLKMMGAKIETEITETNPEEIGTLRIKKSDLKGVTVPKEMIPALIDEIPILCVLACFAHGETLITGAQELRVKESDRIEAVAKNLRAMGAELETFPDGLKIIGPQKLKGAVIETFFDHRLAMAFSIAALGAEGETTILDADHVEISYPNFFETLGELQK